MVTFHQGFYPNIGGGVAVGPAKGGNPLMRLFKANELHQSEEDRVRNARLSYIAQRYKPEKSVGTTEQAPTIADHPEDQGNDE